MPASYEDRGIHIEKIFAKICPPGILVMYCFASWMNYTHNLKILSNMSTKQDLKNYLIHILQISIRMLVDLLKLLLGSKNIPAGSMHTICPSGKWMQSKECTLKLQIYRWSWFIRDTNLWSYRCMISIKHWRRIYSCRFNYLLGRSRVPTGIVRLP